MKISWWKWLVIPFGLYVLIMGFKLPLSPGILKIGQNDAILRATVGESITFDVYGYNTNFQAVSDLAVWLWFPDDRLIASDEKQIISDNLLKATFSIPTDLKVETSQGLRARLLIDNNEEGHYFKRDAIIINKADAIDNEILGKYEPLAVIKSKALRAIPFQPILHETTRNTFFHVAIWMAMFALLLVSCIRSIQYLRTKDIKYDIKANALTSVAIVFGIAGILTGAMWAKYTWGTFWTTDVKLNMTAISLLIYFAFWILRGSITDVDSRARLSNVYNLFAFVTLMILVMVIPRLSDSLHPGNGGNPAFSSYDMDNVIRMVFYPAIIFYILIGLWISDLFYRYEVIRNNIALLD